MVIPQGLSFAVVANVPPVHGLYVAMMTCLVYFILGSSKYLIVGPTAVLSLLVSGFTAQGSSAEQFLADSLLLAFLSGIILMALSLVRLGFLTALLSKPIGVGFTAGAAILIGTSQIKHIFGIKMETPETIIVLFKEAAHLAKEHAKVNWWAVLIFSLCFAYIIILKQIKYTKLIPGPLFALIMATLASWGFNLPDQVGLAVVGNVPKGLPSPSVPIRTWSDFTRAIPFAFVVAFLSFVEAFTIAKPLAIKEGLDLDANQELFALGVANIVGSFFSSFPAAGSFTRTAVNFAAGAKSQFSGLISAFVVLISVLFLTPSLRFLPYCVLAAIVMSGVINLFEIHDMIYIWKTKKRDFVVMCAAFLLTLLLGVDMGVLVAIGFHVLLLVIATIKMRVEELVDSGDGLFVHVLDDPFCQPIPGIVLAKVTDSLVYLNIESFMKQVENLLKAHGSLLPEKHHKIVPRVSSPSSTQQSAVPSIIHSDTDVALDNEPGELTTEPTNAHIGFTRQDFDNDQERASPSLNGNHNQHPLAQNLEEDDDDDMDGLVSGDAAYNGNDLSAALDDSENAPLKSGNLMTGKTPKPNASEEDLSDPAKKHPNAVIFDFSMVNAVDSSAMFRLEELRKILASEGYSMHFAHVHSAVLEVMYRGEFLNELGPNGLFISLREASEYLLSIKDKQMITIP